MSTLQQQINLSFNDHQDLTDTYRDDITSTSNNSTIRHPKGTSPVYQKERRSSGSDKEGSVSSRIGGIDRFGFVNNRSNRVNNNGSRENELPSLEKLLDFLDDEDGVEFEQDQEDYNYNDRAREEQAFSPVRQYNQQQSIPNSSTPPTSFPLNNLNKDERFSIPESPSPLPGSISEMSRVKNGVGIEGKSNGNGNGKGKERAESMRGGEIPLTAEVLDEFSSIISQGSPPNSSSRPRSRLRDIHSPDFPPLASASAPHSDHTGQDHRVDGNKEEEEVDEEKNDLAEELRKAKDYILHLQSEMRYIGLAVKSLRDDPRLNNSSTTNHSANAFDSRNLKNESPRDTLELAKHLIALLPSTNTSNSSPLPSLHSIILSLEFTRSIDNLVYGNSNFDAGGSNRNGDKGGTRKDSDIFEDENLERLLRRVKVWERGVRGGR